MPVDKNGKDVKVGARVRVLKIEPWLLERLPEDEVADVTPMVDEIFEVTEIDERGGVWVEKWWKKDDGGGMRSHSLALFASEMELVE